MTELKDSWISVKDALPPQTDKHYYWLYSESIDNYEMGEYDYARKCFTDTHGVKLFYVTHWQTPKPPAQ